MGPATPPTTQFRTYRLARSKAILDIALEDDAVGLSEPEGFIHRLEGRPVLGKLREDGRLHGTPAGGRRGWSCRGGGRVGGKC